MTIWQLLDRLLDKITVSGPFSDNYCATTVWQLLFEDQCNNPFARQLCDNHCVTIIVLRHDFWWKYDISLNWRPLLFLSHFGNLVFGCFWRWSYENITDSLFIFHFVLPCKRKTWYRKSRNLPKWWKTKNEITKICDKPVINFEGYQNKWDFIIYL